jgi:hypothetical protein
VGNPTSNRTKPVPSWSCSKAVYKPVRHRPLLSVRWITPDDRQRNCPKHLVFHFQNKFEKLVYLVGFIIKKFKLLFVPNTVMSVRHAESTRWSVGIVFSDITLLMRIVNLPHCPHTNRLFPWPAHNRMCRLCVDVKMHLGRHSNLVLHIYIPLQECYCCASLVGRLPRNKKNLTQIWTKCLSASHDTRYRLG